MTIGDLVFLATLLGTLILLIRVAWALAGKRSGQAQMLSKFLGAWLSVYLVALIAVGLLSSPKDLELGQPKCFDEWCFALNGGKQTGTKLALDVTVSNRGHRPQRPDSPRLFLIVDGRQQTIEDPRISDRLYPDQPTAIRLEQTIPSGTTRAEVLVTEGGFPSRLVIGDENSPFHAKASWKVLP